MFHTAAAVRRRLDEAGFAYLPESKPWEVRRGGHYYTVRNNSSIIAFKVGAKLDAYRFQLTASHSDSPTYKVKAAPELSGPSGYMRLNVEAYGGVMDHTWFDRPLSVAGRVLVRSGGRVESRLIAPDADLLIIPRVPIHLDREANSRFSPNRAVDLCPVMSAGELGPGSFDRLVAQEAGVAPEQVLARDLFLVNRQQPSVWGWGNEFISAPRLDDLGCAYISLAAFLTAGNDDAVSVFCCFDNEEVGSNTKQGAMSTFLRDCLERVNAGLGLTSEQLRCALAKSMLVSCDNAHAVHPNHPELADTNEAPVPNGGVVVKHSPRYATDAVSAAAFQEICRRAQVPTQHYANRPDQAGGATLGNIANTKLPVNTVDIGMAQLAMHSCFETMGSRDVAHFVRAVTACYEAALTFTDTQVTLG